MWNTTRMIMCNCFRFWLISSFVIVQGFVPSRVAVSRHASGQHGSEGLLYRTTSTSLYLRNLPLIGRFRRKKASTELELPPMIQVGQSLPDVDVEEVLVPALPDTNLTGVAKSIREILPDTDNLSILVGMPGAFTSTCSGKHLPGFLTARDELARLGVDRIAIVTVNDRFVNGNWAQKQGLVTAPPSSSEDDEVPVGKLAASRHALPISIVSDGDGALVRQLGLMDDMGFGLGVRSKRFLLLLRNGVVDSVQVDEGMEACVQTSADSVLNALRPPDLPGSVDSSGSGGIPGLALVGSGALLFVMAAVLLMGGGGSETVSSSNSGETFSLLQNFK